MKAESRKIIDLIGENKELLVPIPAPVIMMSEKDYKNYKKLFDDCIGVNPYMLGDVNNVRLK